MPLSSSCWIWDIFSNSIGTITVPTKMAVKLMRTEVVAMKSVLVTIF